MTRLLLAALALLLPFGARANGGERHDPITDLVVNVARVFDAMGIPLDWDDGDLVSLVADAGQLTDPRTGLPYRTARGRAIPYYVLDPAGSRMCAPILEPPAATVLFIGGVHPNEVSPLYSSWEQLVGFLRQGGSPHERTRIVYVPLANPDGMISSFDRTGRTARHNAEGVDLNRDFGSADPQSETRFIQDLIAAYQPTHIVSLHAPFGWLDYDGPGARRGAALPEPVRAWMRRVRERAPTLGIEPSFGTYPGSLGEYAGEGLGIHTLTFEYPSKARGRAVSDWLAYGDALTESLRVPGD